MIKPLPFDSELFGYPVGAVDWQDFHSEEEFFREVNDFKLVYLVSDFAVSYLSAQIIPVDVKILFQKKLENRPEVEGVQTFSQENPTTFDPKEMEVLRFLAWESGAYSRFKTDPRLRNQEFELLYDLWIKQAIAKNELIIGQKFEGMITYSYQEETGKIGLVAVHPDHRQKGWGKKLVLAAENLLYTKGVKNLQIPTQESNIPAMKLYEKLGYQIIKKTYIYHYWSENSRFSS